MFGNRLIRKMIYWYYQKGGNHPAARTFRGASWSFSDIRCRCDQFVILLFIVVSALLIDSEICPAQIMEKSGLLHLLPISNLSAPMFLIHAPSHKTTGSFQIQQQQAKGHPHKVLTEPCQSCHVFESFTKIKFDHNKTSYPLEGKHQAVACLSCHSVENFSKVETSCFSCHQDVHQAKMGPECERCHSPTGWQQFDAEAIHERTRFPLLGRHLLVDCATCHESMPQTDFALTSSRCESCHQQEYLETTTPNHIVNGFPPDCENCHQMTRWQPGFLPDHDALFFQIFSGRHKGRWESCATCHTDPANTSFFTCFECHAHNQSSMDSRHRGISGYAYNSLTCVSCHGPGEIRRYKEHDIQFFPIFSGTHNNTWIGCADCHTDSYDRKTYSCVTCHEHSSELMNPAHKAVTGYIFESNSCLGCHPNGMTGDFFEHDAAFFPIYSGVHNGTWDDCTNCHTDRSNRTVYSCVTCHEHSQELMDPAHTGIADYDFNSTNCLACHPGGEIGDFEQHDNLYFPIYSGAHRNQWENCVTCHNESGNRKVFTCIDCHEHNKDSTDRHHTRISDYRWESNACYDCHPRGRGDD